MDGTGGSIDLSTSRKATLTGLVEPRLAVERHFAAIGHTYRHGKAFRFFDTHILRPGLTLGLKAIGLYGRGRRNTLRHRVQQFTLRFPNLPPALEGFCILHVSDFHIDGVDGLDEALAHLLQTLPCDLCVFTGDYRFEDRGPFPRVYPRMQRVVSAIQSRHGIFGILGNHDPAEIAFGLEEMGVRMLVNEHCEIAVPGGSLWLAGVDDPFDYRCHDLPKALSGIPPGAFTVLLAHCPELYEEAQRLGVQFYLTGHTHGGQIRLPWWGALKHNANCPQEYTLGAWNYQGMHGYTTSGAGCSSVPVRFHCPPEVALFELRREA